MVTILPIIVEAFGFSTVKVILGEERVAGGNIPATLFVSFPKGGNYPVKITAKSGRGQQIVEGSGNVVVRDVATSDACDMSVQSIWSTRSGRWDDPTVWTGGRVPQASDWVMVRSGHEVKLPAVTTAQIKKKEVLKVKGLCIDKNAKLGRFFYKEWKTLPPGLLTSRSIRGGLRASFRASDACNIEPTKIAKKLDPPGSWDDANTWNPPGVPGKDDSVRIPAGATVVVPYSNTLNVNPVDSLCIKQGGILRSPTELPPDGQQYWLVINASNLTNRGTIQSSDGISGGPGVGIYLGTPNEFDNEGTIQSGNGGDAGNGGPIRVEPTNATNKGSMILGNGGQCNAHMGWCPASGSGGSLTISGMGEVNIGGTIQGGSGGDAGSVGVGSASEININGNPATIKNNAVTQGKNGYFYEDPIQLKLESNINIHSGDIYFVSDEDGKIEVGNLPEGAITAERTLTWAIGQGGIIDFSQVSDKAFRAGEEMTIHADNILLPPGKTLEQLVDAPKLTVGPAKLLARAAWSVSDETILGKPGESIVLPLSLDKLGPATDTYNLTMTATQAWPLCKLPETVTVNSQRQVELECKVVLPLTYDAENLLTVTATSQSDPSLILTSQLRLQVESEQDKLQFPNADDAVTVQDSQWTLISKTENVEVFPFSATPELNDESIQMTLGSTLTTDGQSSVMEAAVQPNGDVVFSSPPLEPLAIGQDGSLLITEGTVQVTFNSEGAWTGIDLANPQHKVAMTPDGKITATDDTAIVVTLNEDGSFTGSDEASGTEVTIDKQGQKIVTHPEFPGMQAVVNPDTLTITDTSEPNVAAIFDLKTGQYQLVNTMDGSCYSEDSNQRKSFWRHVAGFVAKAAGFVAKVANVITPVTNVIGQVAKTVNKVVGAIINAAPKINTWANKILNWACANCHPLIAGIAGFFANTTVVNGGFLNMLGKIQSVSTAITSVTNLVPKVVNIAQNVANWFGGLRMGQRAAARVASKCDVWEPINEHYTASGILKDDAGQPLANVTIEMCDKTTTTDALGYWSIADLVEGTCTVKGSLGNFSCLSTVELGNEEYDAAVTCEPVTTLTFKAKAHTSKAIRQGEELIYTFTIINGGQLTATGVVFSEQVPTGAELLSIAASNAGICDAAKCTLSDLLPGAMATVTVRLRANQAGILKNLATLTSHEYPVAVQTSQKEVKPYLSVTITDTPDPVVMGGELHYDVEVALSPLAPIPTAEQVALTLQLPAGTLLKTVTTADAETCDSSQYPVITCEIGDLSVNHSALISLDVTLTDGGLLVLTHEAKVTASNYPTTTDRERTKIDIPDHLKVDTILAVDTTNSMQQEIDGVITALKQLIKEIDPSTAPTVALVTFKDDVRVEAYTGDLKVLLAAVSKLKVAGGGLCPEASAEALELALQHVKDGGTVLIATDAPPYEDANLDKIAELIESKHIKFHSIVTEGCTDSQ